MTKRGRQTEMESTIERLLEVGPLEHMREIENAKGNDVLVPGEVSWLPLADWPEDIVVTLDGDDVRIILIEARQAGDGAFSRMITAIAKQNLRPVVLAPMSKMIDILTRWGWRQRFIGKGYSREEQWRPSWAWLAERKKRA